MLELLDAVDVGFCILNSRRGLVSVDEVYARILGLDLARLDVTTLPCCTYADDAVMVSRMIRDVVAGHEERLYRKRSVRSNGDLVWVENRLSVLERGESTTLLLATRVIERPDHVSPSAPAARAWEPQRLARYVGDMTAELTKLVTDAHLPRTAALLSCIPDVAALEAPREPTPASSSVFLSSATPFKSRH